SNVANPLANGKAIPNNRYKQGIQESQKITPLVRNIPIPRHPIRKNEQRNPDDDAIQEQSEKSNPKTCRRIHHDHHPPSFIAQLVPPSSLRHGRGRTSSPCSQTNTMHTTK